MFSFLLWCYYYYILVKKFGLLTHWFTSRYPSRSLTFKKWLYNHYFSKYTNPRNDCISYKDIKKVHISHIYPRLNVQKNLICNHAFILGRNARAKSRDSSSLNFLDPKNTKLIFIHHHFSKVECLLSKKIFEN